jgi:hypothetical protein
MRDLPKWMHSHNPAHYNHKTGLYDNKSGSFLTSVEANGGECYTVDLSEMLQGISNKTRIKCPQG